MQKTNKLAQYTQHTVNIAAKHMKALISYIKDITSPLVDAIQDKITNYGPQIDKVKQFYNNNKQIILIIGATTLTYYLMRPSNVKKQDKIKIKKEVMIGKGLGSKTFISDNSDDYNEQPSGATRRSINSSGKQQLPRKIKQIQTKILQRIESFSQQQQNEDKIFFEMYKTYQNNGQ